MKKARMENRKRRRERVEWKKSGRKNKKAFNRFARLEIFRISPEISMNIINFA